MTKSTGRFKSQSSRPQTLALYAMDTIQGLPANLVWITPKVREELQHKDNLDGSHSIEIAKRR